MRGFLQRRGLFGAILLIVAGLLSGVTAYLARPGLQAEFERLLHENHDDPTSEGWSPELIDVKIRKDRNEMVYYTGLLLAGVGVLIMVLVLRYRSVEEMADDLDAPARGPG